MKSLALLTQIYLKINRLDLANKELRRMEQTDDDHSLTQLTRAWVGIAEVFFHTIFLKTNNTIQLISIFHHDNLFESNNIK